MVKLFAAGDLHSDRIRAKELAQKAIDYEADLIVLNGDLVEEHDTEGVIGYFTRTGKPVIIVPGNHDWLATEFLAERYKALNLHGKSVIFRNIGLFGCGGANIGPHMLLESEIYNLVKKTHGELNTTKRILVSHVHPSGTQMERLSDFVKGSIGLRKAIESTKPDIVLCGHVHEAEGIEEKIGNTRIINVGKRGKLIDIN